METESTNPTQNDRQAWSQFGSYLVRCGSHYDASATAASYIHLTGTYQLGLDVSIPDPVPALGEG